MVSTFVQSAQRVSGTTEMTDTDVPLGYGGLGSKGYILVKNKHGHFHWDQMWINGIPEDYKVH